MQYPVESFTEAEIARLEPHFTNLDQPVFALVNLPETVKGALFARYSRYDGTLRRLFLDEFADSLPAGGDWETDEGTRAAELYDRIFLGYGDDSVAQLGGAHIACEWVSNVLTKVLQRPRMASYLEQSTRYIRYDGSVEGLGYRYYRDARLGPQYEQTMDGLFSRYSDAIPQVAAWAAGQFPAADGVSPAAHDRAIEAKSLDLLRGMLPAAALSHMGIFASGQTYEQLILHLLAHPLPEAQDYGRMLLETLKQVIPSFVSRVERPDRGGEWIGYLEQRGAAGREWTNRLGIGDEQETDAGPSVKLLHVDGSEDDLLCSLVFEQAGQSETAIRAAVAKLSGEERAQMLADFVGNRANRRHRPGRGFEAVRYRFEIVADYGAFRDLQRHRMLTVQWQTLGPDLGAGVPEELEQAGVADSYREGLETSAAEYRRLASEGFADSAPYALCLGYRIRFVLDCNAREAMQLIELRSGREGHPSYRAVAHEMQRAIAQHHPAVAASMVHVDNQAEPRLERILSEMRTEARSASQAG
ncbi:MAG: thymidylate synthase [Actinobacteria bacterium]|uniref:Unannotated protein n=1 Tax=freshwater metagenome TaxID=449393 RepID=A0A6J5ZTZ3_9ZZZZ|nr:thymidylate synthase [Actinomycetota bacterium]